jgi:hypothetical protein
VAFDPGQPPAFRPTPVPVHNDGNVTGN